MKKLLAIIALAAVGTVSAQDLSYDTMMADSDAVEEISEPEVESSSSSMVSSSSSLSSSSYSSSSSSSVRSSERYTTGTSARYTAGSSERYVEGSTPVVSIGEPAAVAAATDDIIVPPASEIDDDSIPELKRCKYTFRSWGLGLAAWHNWKHDVKDSKKKKRDWDLALLLHHGRIWEMTSHGAITLNVNANIAYGDALETQGIGVLGGRYFFFNEIFTPYIGGGFGLGLQYDGYLRKFGDKFAFGFAGNFEGGIVIFRTTTTQLELGASYNVLVNVLDVEHVYGAFNFYLAINY